MSSSPNATASKSQLYKAFFDDATLSDLTVRLSDRTVRVHRIVLCRQSEYFTKLLTGPFQESGFKEVVLEEDDPDSMVALLRHIYDLPYDELLAHHGSLLRPHAMVYVVADKYQIKGLQVAVNNKMKRIIKSYKDLKQKTAGPIIDDFLEALRIIITGTTVNDELARKVMVEACIMNLRHLQQRPALASLLSESAELGAAIITHDDLECGLSGAWACSKDCEDSGRGCMVLCSDCDQVFERDYVWAHRDELYALCPGCDCHVDWKCSACEGEVRWIRRGLI